MLFVSETSLTLLSCGAEGTIHLAVDNSSNLVNAANWAYHDLQASEIRSAIRAPADNAQITKQKDTEPVSSDPLNGQE